MAKKTPKPKAEPEPAPRAPRELSLTAPVAAGLLVGVYLAAAVAFRALVPYGLGPDEASHALFVATLAGQVTPAEGWAWGLPVFSTDPRDANFELHQPPLYYALAALLHRVAGVGGAAALSLVAGALLVWLTWRLVGEVAADDLALGAAAVVALLPMHAFMGLRVSNDPWTAVWWAICCWCWVRGLREGPSRRLGLVAGLALGAALLTKQNSVALVPLAFVAAGLAGWSRRAWRPAAEQLAVSLAVAAALAGWWYARNRVVYGDLFAHAAFNERFLHPEAHRATPATLMAQFAAVGRSTPYWQVVFDWTVRTFVIYLGSGFERLPSGVTNLHLTLTALAGGASLWVFARRWRRRGLDPATAAGLLLAVGLLAVVALYVQFNRTYFQAQGRYLHVMLPGWALAYVAGLRGLIPSERRARRYAVALIPAWFGLLELLLLAVYLPGLYAPAAGTG